MGQSLAIPRVIPEDWKRLDLIINKIKLHLGSAASPTWAGLTLTGNLSVGGTLSVAGASTLTDLTLTGTLNCRQINPDDHDTYSIGEVGRRWHTIHVQYVTAHSATFTNGVTISGGLGCKHIVPDDNDMYSLGEVGRRWHTVHTQYVRAVDGFLTGDLSVAGTINAGQVNPDLATSDLGEAGRRWRNLYLSGATFTADGMEALGNIIIPDDGWIGSVTTNQAIQIEADGDVVMPGMLDVTGDVQVAGNILLTTDRGGIGYSDNSPMLVFDDSNNRVEFVGNIMLADDGIIGVADGTPSILFDDTDGQAEITGTLTVSIDAAITGALTAATINGAYFEYTATGNYSIGDATTLDALDATPTHNIAIGDGAGSGITNGDDNIFIGYRAGYSSTTGGHCVAIGYEALYTGIVYGGATAIGYQAMKNHSTGNGNTCIGYQAGLGSVLGGGAVYTYNTFIGEMAGCKCDDGGSNVIIGKSAGYHINDGSTNIFLGAFAGHTQVDNSNLLIIDNQERADVATDITNAILYGVMAALPANQTLRINAEVGIGKTPSLAKLDIEDDQNFGLMYKCTNDEGYSQFGFRNDAGEQMYFGISGSAVAGAFADLAYMNAPAGHAFAITIGGVTKLKVASDGGLFTAGMKSGTDQANAGASAGELYFDTNDDNTVKMGV